MANFLRSPRCRTLIFAAGGFLLLAAVLLGVNRSARADVAPPKAPPGANPESETIPTNVRMMAEKVVIEIQDESDIEEMGTARVWAEFDMKNLGSTTEWLMVRFPISSNDGWGEYPEIEDMFVYVDNAMVETQKIILEGEPEEWDDPISWVEFEVKFPPQEVVEIEVDYTLRGTGEYPFVSYGYLLETGAGWQGTIGSAEVIVRFPYRAEPANVFLEGSPGWGRTTPGAELDGNEVRWQFENFEPERQDNISIALVWPSLWNQIIRQRQYVDDFPEDGEGWGRLGKLYKDASLLRKSFREDPGGEPLFEWSKQAYQKAITLLPGDALWRAGYADLLFWHSTWTYQRFQEGRAEFIEALRQLSVAYTLDPQEEFILDYLKRLSNEGVEKTGRSYVFHWLTQTPTLIPNQQAAASTATQPPTPTRLEPFTATPEPSNTPLPTDPPPAVEPAGEETEEESPGVSDGISLPFCGSLLVFPLALAAAEVFPGMRQTSIPRRRGK